VNERGEWHSSSDVRVVLGESESWAPTEIYSLFHTHSSAETGSTERVQQRQKQRERQMHKQLPGLQMIQPEVEHFSRIILQCRETQ